MISLYFLKVNDSEGGAVMCGFMVTCSRSWVLLIFALSLTQYFIIFIIVYANHVNSSVTVPDVVGRTLINNFQSKFIDQVPQELGLTDL